MYHFVAGGYKTKVGMEVVQFYLSRLYLSMPQASVPLFIDRTDRCVVLPALAP